MEEIVADLNGVEVPAPMCLPAMEVWAAASRLGTDINGRVLYGEMRQWMDENRIVHRAQRRMYERLFVAAQAAKAELSQLRKKQDEEAAAAQSNAGFAGAVKG